MFATNDIDMHARDAMFTFCRIKANGIVRAFCVTHLIDLIYYQHDMNQVDSVELRDYEIVNMKMEQR